MERRSIEAARRLLPERPQKYNKFRNQVRASKTYLELLALKDVRTDWLEALDLGEIKQQVRGEAASTFAFIKLEFNCPVRKAIAEVFGGIRMVGYCACVVHPLLAKTQDPYKAQRGRGGPVPILPATILYGLRTT